MINYVDIFCNILESVTNNNDPDIFAYEMTGYKEPWEWHYVEIWEAHVMQLYPDELETAKDVYNSFGGTTIDDEHPSVKTVYNAHRVSLYFLTEEMMTKYFKSSSFTEIYNDISAKWDHVYTNDACEEFYTMNGVYVAFDKNEEIIYFGNVKTELTDCILEPNSDDDSDDDDC